MRWLKSKSRWGAVGALFVTTTAVQVGFAVNAPQAHAAGQCDVVSPTFQMCWTTGGEVKLDLFYDAARRVDAAPAGSTVRVAMYQWHTGIEDPLLNALAAAHNRGVDVKVLLGNASGHNDSDVPGANPGAGDTLRANLGTTNVLYCTAAADNKACLRRDTSSPGLMHAKFVLIRHPSGHVEVTTLSSNITYGQYQKAQNSLSVVGDTPLYDAYLGYWNRMANKDWGSWTSDSDLGRDGSWGNKAYFFPRASGDPIASIIDGKSCAGSGEQIRILSSDDDFRPSLRTALQNAKRRGCFVRITYAKEAAKSSILNSANNNITASQFVY